MQLADEQVQAETVYRDSSVPQPRDQAERVPPDVKSVVAIIAEEEWMLDGILVHHECERRKRKSVEKRAA